MTERWDLKLGAFYWVLPVFDPDADGVDTQEVVDHWTNREQPARYAGKDDMGEHTWNYMGVYDASDWPVRWIGEEIKR